MRIENSTTWALTHRRCSVLVLLLLGATALTPAWAADQAKNHDCAPVGSMPNYAASEPPERFAYQSKNFTVAKGDGTDTVTVAGRFCAQDYVVKDGAQPASLLEEQMNYRDQLGQLGAKILWPDSANTVAKLVKDGKETWIWISGGESSYQVYVVEKQPLQQTLTAPSGNDYKLLGHMPNYALGDPEKRNFDQYSFTIKDGENTRDVMVQGARYTASYTVKDGVPPSSVLEVQGNYHNALEKLGAQILWSDDSNIVARLNNHGQNIWIKISGGGPNYQIYVIEEKAFQATIKPAQASELKAALDKDGHVALYINFDFDKATLRPDAAPVMAQVLALLKGNPGLKLSIVGNTDNVGGHDYNVKLSQARAATVVATLVKDGIAAGRLTSSGVGPDKPIADNADSAGRAKNRRVELVKV